MTAKKLDASIPANNQKVIEIYNKIKNEELDPSPLFQRKLVWKKQHKFNFITTILMNYPFPEVYVAPGRIDTESLRIKDLIVDGQQRLSTIMNYIEGKDVFSIQGISIERFADLSNERKAEFLNYEVSVRYLKNATEEQIIEIFQRINSTDYALNTTERLNARWGDSEFICFGKQMIEDDLTISYDLINYRLSNDARKFMLEFFHRKYRVFTENDVNRMLALQYILTLLATLCEGVYFNRNNKVQEYIEKYYEEFIDAGELEHGLMKTLSFIDGLALSHQSFWFNKANMFTLIVELYKFDVGNINKELFSQKLVDLEMQYVGYSFAGVNNLFYNSDDVSPEVVRYFEFAREGVNNKSARDYRGDFISRIIAENIYFTNNIDENDLPF